MLVTVHERERRKELKRRDGEGVRARREKEEILQPCPLIVFSVVKGSSPAMWEHALIPRDQGRNSPSLGRNPPPPP